MDTSQHSEWNFIDHIPDFPLLDESLLLASISWPYSHFGFSNTAPGSVDDMSLVFASNNDQSFEDGPSFTSQEIMTVDQRWTEWDLTASKQLEMSSQIQFPCTSVALKNRYQHPGDVIALDLYTPSDLSVTMEQAQNPLGSNTKRHRKTNGGFPCSIASCGRVFSRACDLRKHKQRNHLPEAARPLGCTLCTRRFVDRKDLRRHIEGRHGEKVPQTPEPSPKRSRMHSPARSVAAERRSRYLKVVVQMIHNPRARLARNTLWALEGYLDGLQASPPPTRTYDPLEMVAITDPIVLVTSKLMALDLSSEFCPDSPFKLRSLKVPMQRAAVEQDFRNHGSSLAQTLTKVVMPAISKRCFRTYDLRADQLPLLMSYLCQRLNVPGATVIRAAQKEFKFSVTRALNPKIISFFTGAPEEDVPTVPPWTPVEEVLRWTIKHRDPRVALAYFFKTIVPRISIAPRSIRLWGIVFRILLGQLEPHTLTPFPWLVVIVARLRETLGCCNESLGPPEGCDPTVIELGVEVFVLSVFDYCASPLYLSTARLAQGRQERKQKTYKIQQEKYELELEKYEYDQAMHEDMQELYESKQGKYKLEPNKSRVCQGKHMLQIIYRLLQRQKQRLQRAKQMLQREKQMLEQGEETSQQEKHKLHQERHRLYEDLSITRVKLMSLRNCIWRYT